MFAIIYRYANPSSGRFGKRSIYAAGSGYCGGGRGGRFNGRGLDRVHGGRCGQGVRGIGGHVEGGHGGGSGANEIDISDVTRYFEYSESAGISNNTRESITEDLVRTNFLANKKRRTTSSVGAEKENKNRFISQIITGVQNVSQN